MSDHIFRDCYIIVDLPVVHLEPQPHKIGKYGRCAGHGFNGRCSLARDGSHDRETGRGGSLEVSKSILNDETCGRSIDEGSSYSADGDNSEVGEERLRHDVRSCVECQHLLQ